MSEPSRNEQTNGADSHGQPNADTAVPADGAKPVNGAETTGNETQTVPAEISMEAQLSEAQAKAAEYLDGWQRARAEFANYRKRADQERAEAYGNAAVDTLRKL